MILYGRGCGTTGRALGKLLNINASRIPIDQPTVIRWGCSRGAPELPDTINSAEAIRNTARGVRSLDILSGVGIAVPLISLTPFDAKCLARKNYHRGGRDIVICNSPEDAPVDADFFSKFIPVGMETRVHVFDGQVIKAFIKVPSDDAHPIIRTATYGWGYRRIRWCNKPRMCRIALAAVAALGLVFGGVDMGWNRSNKEWYVFEVNSAPGLNSRTLKLYANLFAQYFTERGYNVFERFYRAREDCKTGTMGI